MNAINQLWQRVSCLGTSDVFDEKLKTEVISVNQLSIVAFLFTVLGTYPILFMYPFSPAHIVIMVIGPLYLLGPVFNTMRWYLAAKLTPILNAATYYFLTGLAFGLGSQAHTVYLILIAYIMLFFFRSNFWTRVGLVLPLIAFPIVLLILSESGKLPLLNAGIPLPPYFGLTNFLFIALVAMFFFNLAIDNVKAMAEELNESRLSLLEHDTTYRKQEQGLKQKIRATVHDLKSPLTSALALMEIINSTADQKEKSTSLNYLRQSLTKLKSQVETVMEKDGEFDDKLDIQPVSLENEVQEVLAMISHYPGYKRIKFTLDIEQEIPFATDKNCLRVILSNLLSNAVKYMDTDKGRKCIDVTGKVEENRCNITIADNGIGISEEDLPRIFFRNFRATGQSEGSGLGLALVKKALDLIDGEIKVDSKLGEGSTIQLVLLNEGPQRGANGASLN